jgi:hypothetical protein
VVADHRDQVVQHDDLADAGNLFRGAVVDLADLAAEHWTGGDRCELHARKDRVDTVDGLAVDLVRRVEALQRLADIDEILGVLERDIRRRRLAARGDGKLAVGKISPAFGVRHLALRRRAACRFDLPLSRRGLNQHGTRARSSLAQRHPERADRVGIAGHLQAEGRIAIELVVRRGVLQRHLREIGVELFGEDHRNRRIDALAHLDLRHHQRGVPVLIDADERVGRELALGHVRRLHRFVRRAHGQMEGKQESARQAALQEAAAREVVGALFCDNHWRPPTTDVRMPPA